MHKRLIINADDLGYAGGSVSATAALHEAGIVTSTTALVNQPYWPKAAAYLRDHPGLGAVVHLVMNEGRPILPPEQVPCTVEYLLSLLNALPDGITELLVHPRTEGWHERECRVLLDPRVRQRMGELGIELISYGDLNR